MIKLTPFFVTVLIAGCSLVPKQTPNYTVVNINTKEPVLSPPKCIPSEMDGGYRESCMEDIDRYADYVKRYNLAVYENLDIDPPSTKPVCGDRMRIPAVKNKPVIESSGSNLSEMEKIDLVIDYTDSLREYVDYLNNTYRTAITRYNSGCE